MPRTNRQGLGFTELSGAIGAAQLGTTAGFAGSFGIAVSGVDFNDDNSDTAIPITLPTGFTRYHVGAVRIYNATGTLTTATFGVFTATGAGGTAVVTSATACTVSTASADTNNNSQIASANNGNTLAYSVASVPTLYFRVQTAQGAARTASVMVIIVPLP